MNKSQKLLTYAWNGCLQWINNWISFDNTVESRFLAQFINKGNSWILGTEKKITPDSKQIKNYSKIIEYSIMKFRRKERSFCSLCVPVFKKWCCPIIFFTACQWLEQLLEISTNKMNSLFIFSDHLCITDVNFYPDYRMAGKVHKTLNYTQNKEWKLVEHCKKASHA